MIYIAQIKVMQLKNLLDPQGKAVLSGLTSLGITGVNDARIGKNIDLTIEAQSQEIARAIADEAAKKLLANAVMEMYEITII
jgi:phosphoribosylformylglycinamidine synthase subunit PurS